MIKFNFERITTRGNYIPEIDGLRFIAITSVVLYHLIGFINIKLHRFGMAGTRSFSHQSVSREYSFFDEIVSHGSIGVPLFFVISAFILGLPFANYFLKNDEKVNIKQYFLRRITRLEPPYLIVMTLLLIGAIFIAKTLTVHEALKSYLASFFYVHNFVYPNELPKISGVAWSLELEFKFYVVAPLMACVFALKSKVLRRSLLLCFAIFFIIIQGYVVLPYKSFFSYVQYFLMGLLLVDFYVTGDELFSKGKYDKIIGLISLIVIFLLPKNGHELNYILIYVAQFSSIFVFYYYVIFNKCFEFMANKIVTSIGGMCYSIYLLHYAVISLFGNSIIRIHFTTNSTVNIFISSIILLLAILLISAAFFIAIERPCMKKDWYKNILSVRNK